MRFTTGLKEHYNSGIYAATAFLFVLSYYNTSSDLARLETYLALGFVILGSIYPDTDIKGGTRHKAFLALYALFSLFLASTHPISVLLLFKLVSVAFACFFLLFMYAQADDCVSHRGGTHTLFHLLVSSALIWAITTPLYGIAFALGHLVHLMLDWIGSSSTKKTAVSLTFTGALEALILIFCYLLSVAFYYLMLYALFVAYYYTTGQHFKVLF